MTTRDSEGQCTTVDFSNTIQYTNVVQNSAQQWHKTVVHVVHQLLTFAFIQLHPRFVRFCSGTILDILQQSAVLVVAVHHKASTGAVLHAHVFTVGEGSSLLVPDVLTCPFSASTSALERARCCGNGSEKWWWNNKMNICESMLENILVVKIIYVFMKSCATDCISNVNKNSLDDGWSY